MSAVVIEDHAVSREALRGQLESLGVRNVAAVGDAEAARAELRRAVAQEGRLTVALIDRRLAAGDGLQLARQIQAEPALAGVKTILLTSIREPLAPEEMTAAGVSRALVKPVRQAQLRETLATLVGHAPAAAREPVAAAPRADEAKSDPPQGLGRETRRILVAEDNRVNQLVICKQLEKLGYSPTVVENGALAVAALAEASFDIVFMDCQMPELDGLEATRRIRAREAERQAAGATRPPVHIIALTAHALTGDREQCLAAGMNDYLSKPVRPEDLAAALGRVPTASV